MLCRFLYKKNKYGIKKQKQQKQAFRVVSSFRSTGSLSQEETQNLLAKKYESCIRLPLASMRTYGMGVGTGLYLSIYLCLFIHLSVCVTICLPSYISIYL